MEFLTESNLGGYLEEIFQEPFIHNKAFVNLKRPDYRNDNHKIIVEYDDPKHYTSSKRIVDDRMRDAFYREHGYRTIRIPMFVQINTEVIKHFFGIDFKFEQRYPHGFISDASTMVLPSDFCELGIRRFLSDISNIPTVYEQTVESLKVKVQKLGNIDYVLPPSIQYILD